MSILLSVVIGISLFFTFSQFGGRLSARSSLVWWLVGIFLLVSSTIPEMLVPIAHFLNIELVSNFVLASLVFFLFLQTLELASESTRHMRSHRSLVSAIAARNYKRENRTGKSLLILPCFNEEQNLKQIIPRVLKTTQNTNIDFCIIDDGSQDNSTFILESLCPKNFVHHEVNIGVSGVLLTAFKIAKRENYDYVIQCDSDGQHPIEKIPELLKFSKDHNLDLLVGSRFALQSKIKENKKSTSSLRLFGIYLIRIGLGIFGQFRVIKDPTSGFRVYSRRACNSLVQNMPDDYPEPESIAILAIEKMRIAEFGVTMMPRMAGESSLRYLKTGRYMVKVLSSLLGLGLRSAIK